MTVTLADIERAAARIAPFVHRTPIMTSQLVDEWLGATVVMKCEQLQRVGAFKYRGATNAVQLLAPSSAARGVAAHSSGNHAAALALAARTRGIAAHIVMPDNTPPIKKRAVAGYGATIVECAPTDAARAECLAEVVAATGAVEIHPFDNDDVIAGAGTAALELLTEVADLDVIVTPVGGGGLVSGTSLAAHGLQAKVRVVAAEPQGADDAARSLAAGRRIANESTSTVCDGLRTSLAERTFAIMAEHVDHIVTVPDEETLGAMRFVWERTKQLIEPSAAITIAAIARDGSLRGQRVGVILSGGNVDFDASTR